MQEGEREEEPGEVKTFLTQDEHSLQPLLPTYTLHSYFAVMANCISGDGQIASQLGWTAMDSLAASPVQCHRAPRWLILNSQEVACNLGKIGLGVGPEHKQPPVMSF